MAIKANRDPRCLFVAPYSVCTKILDVDTRLEYIYRYTWDNQWIKFVHYANKRKVTRKDAEDIFADSVLAINLKIEDHLVVIRCGNIPKQCTNFLAYFWRILSNKVIDLLKIQRKTIAMENGQGRNINTVNSRKPDPDIDSDEKVKILKFIIENLDENDRKRYKIYFEDKLSHEEVVKMGIYKTEGSSRTTKARLILKLRCEWKRIMNNDSLLDNIRWKY